MIAIIMGSDSDLPVMADAARCLEEFAVPYHVDVVSAHRTPEKLYEFAHNAQSLGYRAVIAGAGGAAHLPGMVASMTTLPVIGVPIRSRSLHGVDSVLSILQMPPGVPVATMAINGARNGALLAIRILAVTDASVRATLAAFNEAQTQRVQETSRRLAERGWKQYVKDSDR
jgi:5-(carboxyamino)imidazole ribonucleotide mutase